MKKFSSKELCPCHSQKKFQTCCEPFLSGSQIPENPEKLMRSRYTAYCLSNLNYVQKTMLGRPLDNFNLREATLQAKKCKWISLKVINSMVEENNLVGFVEFIAEYSSYGKIFSLHEKSKFQFSNEKWFYVDGIFM